ncbi:MAG TPA: hypothetical protein VKI44_37225, partial [Acetobacteraceae bacterium]|nr:hypothetical protein [Acetobacteraceae bacterium]
MGRRGAGRLGQLRNRHKQGCREFLQGGPFGGRQIAAKRLQDTRRRLLLLLLSLPDQAFQVQQGFPQCAVSRQRVLEDHRGLLEHP